ncbi:MAG: transposase [Inquilinus sp.]|nr:transposase [Inquilinus sp.]
MMNIEGIEPEEAERRAIELVESCAWPDGPVCPHCGATGKAYRIGGARPGLRKCAVCRRQFTVKVGTLFEGSHIPLYKWVLAIFMMCSSPAGFNASQLHRSLKITYKSAWLVCQRVRQAKKQKPLASLLTARAKGGR